MLDQNQPYRLLLLAFRSFQLRVLRCEPVEPVDATSFQDEYDEGAEPEEPDFTMEPDTLDGGVTPEW